VPRTKTRAPDLKPALPQSIHRTPDLADPSARLGSQCRTRDAATLAQSPPSRCNLHRDHARSIKPHTPSGADPCCPFAPSLHSLSSLSLADEAIAIPGQQCPRNLAGARVDGRSHGSMPTVSPCSSSAPSRFSARPGANAMLHFLSSRAEASPLPSELEAHRRRTHSSAPPRAFCLAGIRSGGSPESTPPPCSCPASLVDPR
jgi:hypothetical protein